MVVQYAVVDDDDEDAANDGSTALYCTCHPVKEPPASEPLT